MLSCPHFSFHSGLCTYPERHSTLNTLCRHKHTQFATPPTSLLSPLLTNTSAEAWRQLRLGNPIIDAAEHSIRSDAKLSRYIYSSIPPALSIPVKTSSTCQQSRKSEHGERGAIADSGLGRCTTTTTTTTTYSNRALTTARQIPPPQ